MGTAQRLQKILRIGYHFAPGLQPGFFLRVQLRIFNFVHLKAQIIHALPALCFIHGKSIRFPFHRYKLTIHLIIRRMGRLILRISVQLR